MNLTNKLALTLVGTVAIAASLAGSCNAKVQAAASSKSDVQVVTVSAKRMTNAEKAAFDQGSSANAVQTVVISAKRLSPQAKIAFDRNNQAAQKQTS